MLKKTFIQVWIGDTIPFWDEFLENRNYQKGWEFVVLSNLNLKGRGNVRVVKFTEDDFNKRVEDKFGFNPGLQLVMSNDRRPNGEAILQPNIHVYNFWPTFGVLFSDYIDADFWGHTCFDIVYGDLNRWFPDTLFKKYDIISNEKGAVCGPFTLYRNDEAVNTLFKNIPDWQSKLMDNDVAFDEHHMTQLVRDKDYFYSMQNHRWGADPKLIFNDGQLIDATDNREIAMWHFNRTKVWPKYL